MFCRFLIHNNIHVLTSEIASDFSELPRSGFGRGLGAVDFSFPNLRSPLISRSLWETNLTLMTPGDYFIERLEDRWTSLLSSLTVSTCELAEWIPLEIQDPLLPEPRHPLQLDVSGRGRDRGPASMRRVGVDHSSSVALVSMMNPGTSATVP